MTATVLVGALIMAAAFVGAFLGHWCAQRLDKRKPRPSQPTVRPVVRPPAGLDDAAARWVRDQGYPEEAIPLVADKARLIHRIVNSRRFPGGR